MYARAYKVERIARSMIDCAGGYDVEFKSVSNDYIFMTVQSKSGALHSWCAYTYFPWYRFTGAEARIAMNLVENFLDYKKYDEQYQLRELVNRLPGMLERVKHPVTGKDGIVVSIVASLNDSHKWDRGRIANWLDELADSGEININFKDAE